MCLQQKETQLCFNDPKSNTHKVEHTGRLRCTTRVKERRTVWIGREWQHWVDEVGVILGTEWTLLHSFQGRMRSNSGNETLRAQKKGKKKQSPFIIYCCLNCLVALNLTKFNRQYD